MTQAKEPFLARWLRLKRAAAAAPSAAPAAAGAAAAPAELPPLESLDFSSDFSPFLRPKVEEALKRAALKKLFHSGQFNQMDGLDVYIDDYSLSEPIPQEMLRQMAQARELLFPPGEKEENTPSAPPENPATLEEKLPPEDGTIPTA